MINYLKTHSYFLNYANIELQCSPSTTLYATLRTTYSRHPHNFITTNSNRTSNSTINSTAPHYYTPETPPHHFTTSPTLPYSINDALTTSAKFQFSIILGKYFGLGGATSTLFFTQPIASFAAFSACCRKPPCASTLAWRASPSAVSACFREACH